MHRREMNWQPHHCILLHRTEEDMRSCLVNRHVCFVGDSHMRNAFNGYVALTEGSGVEDSYWSDHNGKYVLESVYASYIADFWGEAVDTGICTDIIVNFGQWPASYQAGAAAWTAHQFGSRALEVAHRLVAARGQGKQAYWMTINSMMLTYDRQGQDWRSDPQLLLFNEIAWKTMAHSSIPIIDTWSIVAPVAELSYDHCHYKGHVGQAVAWRVITALCAANDASHSGTVQR